MVTGYRVKVVTGWTRLSTLLYEIMAKTAYYCIWENKKASNHLRLLAFLDVWCRRRESNSHGRSPLPPQDSVSTNSTTSANFYYCCGTLFSTGISCGAEVCSAVCSDAGMVTGTFESTGNSRGGKVGNGATCTFSMTVPVLL